MSWVRSGRVVWAEDAENKAVVFLTLSAFAYTGAAKVGGRTDRWICEVLGPTSGLSEGFNALKAAATQEFRRPSLRDSTLAMVGAGWDPKPNSEWNSFYVVISNAAQNALPQVRERARTQEATAFAFAPFGARRDAFDWYAVALQPWLTCLLHVAGQPFPRSRIDDVLRNLKRAVRAEVGPIALIRLLAEEIWAIAETNERVGRSLMAVSMPRTAARRSGPVELVGGPPHPDQFTAMYLPARNAGPVYYLPNLAGGGTCFTDASVEPL